MRRFARGCRVTAGLLLFVGVLATSVGCRPASDKSRGSDHIVTGIGPHSLSGGGTEPRAAELFAINFLKALNEGTATPAMLTPQFKRVIAEPVFTADRAAGYSDDGAAAWLAQFKGRMAGATITPHVAGTGPDAPGFTGTAAGGSPLRSRYAMRLVNPGDGWKADWLIVGPDGGSSPQNFSPGGPAGFAGLGFLIALTAKEHNLAEALMTPGLKARMAPPLDSDQARGYNRGLLMTKLAHLRDGATGVAIDRSEGQTVTGTLTNGVRRVLTLKFARGERPWDWLVDDIEVK